MKRKHRRAHKQLKDDLAALSTDKKRTRFLLDANVDDLALLFLHGEGYNVRKVARPGMDDADVWKAASEDGRVLVTHDRDFWSNRFGLDRSPGLAYVPRQSAEDVVAAVGFLKSWPTIFAGCKIWFASDTRLHVKLRTHGTGRLETLSFVYRNSDWVAVARSKRK